MDLDKWEIGDIISSDYAVYFVIHNNRMDIDKYLDSNGIYQEIADKNKFTLVSSILRGEQSEI